MCRRCGNNNDMYLDTVIYKDDDTVVDQLCSNCMARTAYDKEFPRAKGIYTSELSGAHGAIKIVDAAGSDEPDTYFLLWSEAERLFRHELTPEEFFALDKNHHDRYLIHDDFYDYETGEALQPMSDI